MWFSWWGCSKIKLVNVELTAINGLTITIPCEKNNAGGFKDLNNSGRVIDIPPDNKRKLIPVSDVINYISKRPQGSTSGIAAYQTFTKQIMHETINKMIPDKCDDFNSNPGSREIVRDWIRFGPNWFEPVNQFTVNFEKAFDPTTGEELCICNILDKNGRCCKKTYKSFGYSTGNLKRHLDEVHGINEVEIVGERKKSQRKITDYSQVTHNHPPYIQKKKEEALLKWILKTNQPLSIVTNEAYIEKMKVFDPAFSVPGAKKLRTMIGNSYSFNKEALREIFQQRIDYISLTTDFWTSRAKHGYLSITASFIATAFSVVDIMLDIKYVPAPHTAVVIADSLYESILDWNLLGRIVSIVTDSGANMIASIQLLNQKPGCYAIKRLPCVSHTLQLAIGKGLMIAEVLVAHRLKNVQKHLGYTEALQLVQDVSTRWNSSYYAFDGFFFLKDAIIQLQTDLCTSTNREEKKDGNKLRKIMLSDEEWDLVDELITLLMPFEQATCEFSGGSYVTLSKMVPKIKELIFNLGDFYEASLLGGFGGNWNNPPPINNNPPPINETNSIPDIDDDENEHQLVDFINDISLTCSYQGYKHYRLLKGKRKNVLSNDHHLLDEVKSYLDLSLASENESPLEWWKARTQAFPYLSKLALKYLSIPASSVSIAKMLFLKRNMKFMNVYAPSWDSNEDIESE
ncbi:5891_t:CDS:2 [Entrophospora sp. SA101]|nr:5891_t:CDS:2 [Entrophospora sp. SA101]